MQQPAPGAVERVEERLALHELLRVGLARQEDLRLLQQVVQDDPPLPSAAITQAFKECRYREEWRCMRETQLLARVATTSLTSLSDASVQLIMQQVEQVKQMQAQQRSTRIHHAGRHGPSGLPRTSAAWVMGSPGASLPPASQPAPAASSLGAALGLYGAPPQSAAAGHRAAGALAPRPLGSGGRLGGGMAGSGGGRGGGAGVPPRTAPPGGKQTSRTLTPSPARTSSRQSPPTLMTTDQLRKQLSLGHASPTSSSSSSVPSAPSVPSSLSAPQPTTSAPPAAPATPTRTSANRTSTTAGGGAPRTPPPRAERSHSMPSTPPRTAPPALRPASPATTPAPVEAPRFQRLLRLQGALLSGLQQHAEAGGAQAAVAALEESVAQMQAHFQECMSEAAQAKGTAPTAAASDGTAGAHQSILARHANWSRLLPLGQLGLTLSDMTRLQQLRQHMAARTIQRATRQHLRRRRHARAVAEANAKAARAAQRLRDHAAQVIQRYWRGHAARRRCATLRAAAARRRRERAADSVRQLCAALRIQRAWRRHRRSQRVRRLIAASPWTPAMSPWTSAASPWTTTVVAGTAVNTLNATTPPDSPQPATSQPAANFVSKATVAAGAAAQAGSSSSSGPAAPVAAAEHAAVVIQAVVRGWLARRSTAVWWARSLGALRRRRAANRVWAAHHAYMQATMPLQQQLVDNMAAEARAQQVITRDAQREQQQFEANWLRWLATQHATAVTQPLPRGWVPHRDTSTNEDVFLDTRTGALHAHHPAVLQLKHFAASQRDQALAQLQQRMAAAAQRIAQLQATAAHQRGQLMRQMHEVLSRQMLQGPGAGTAGTRAAPGL